MASKSALIISPILFPGDTSIEDSFIANSNCGSSVGGARRSGEASDFVAKPRLVTKSIAIVDDEEDLLSLLPMLVKNLGYHTEFVARDGDEIIQAVADGIIHPDLILMDHRMMTMNGLEAAEKILQLKPEIKIVIESADDSVREKAISAGFYFLQKPYSKASLARAIHEAIDNSSNRQG